MNLGRTQEMCHTVIIERKKRACLNCFQYGKVGRSLKKKKKKEKKKNIGLFFFEEKIEKW